MGSTRQLPLQADGGGIFAEEGTFAHGAVDLWCPVRFMIALSLALAAVAAVARPVRQATAPPGPLPG